MKENTVYTVKLLKVEHPEGKNMRTLVLAIPAEKTIFKGISFFLDNAKNAQRSLSIWIRNIFRQTKTEEAVKDSGHVEYMQLVEKKLLDKDPEKYAVELMLKQLEKCVDKEFKCTYLRTVTDDGEVYFNLVPYELTVKKDETSEGLELL